MEGLQAGGRWGRGSAIKYSAELGRDRMASATGPLRGLGQVMIRSALSRMTLVTGLSRAQKGANDEAPAEGQV